MIVILFTGGTISMKLDPATGAAVPALSGADILEAVPSLGSVADIARACGYSVTDELMGRIDALRRGVLAGTDPDPDALSSAIEQMARTVAGYPDPRRLDTENGPGDTASGPSRVNWRLFRRRATPGTSP